MKLERLIFLAVIALPVGFIFELAFSLLAPIFLTWAIPNIGDILMNDNIVFQVSKFLLFHVFGWIASRSIADAVEEEPEDYYGEYAESYVIEKDGHLIEVYVH